MVVVGFDSCYEQVYVLVNASERPEKDGNESATRGPASTDVSEDG